MLYHFVQNGVLFHVRPFLKAVCNALRGTEHLRGVLNAVSLTLLHAALSGKAPDCPAEVSLLRSSLYWCPGLIIRKRGTGLSGLVIECPQKVPCYLSACKVLYSLCLF